MNKRPTRPTAAITAEAVRYLKAGVALEVVARLILGAKHDQMYRWLVIGAGQDPTKLRIPKAYRLFHDAVTKAQAEAEARNTLALQRDGSPKWALEWLKRRAPERWAAEEATAVLVPFVGKGGEAIMLPAAMASQLAALKREPYTDPRMLPEDTEPEPKEPLALDDGQPYIDPSRRPPVIVETTSRVLDEPIPPSGKGT